MTRSFCWALLPFVLIMLVAEGQEQSTAERPRVVSGIYPHLAMFNGDGECGTGAVVPWAGRLWAVTYAPHRPTGSDDKLYEITADLKQIVRPESIGGTPANRMIHRESEQLFIGPYAIDKNGGVRAIPYKVMYGRPTGNARHLFDPAGKIYYATMEEGVYEVDVKSLAVKELWTDEHIKEGRHADFPGYHGKGLYSGQGRLIYANNGDHAPQALKDPRVPSGILASWDGKADKWTIVRRNQFTEVTGPGGIYGNEKPESDPLWSVGWDHRSLLLQLLDGGEWRTFRLPKADHSYDGAHGWNTEWPRIREIGTAEQPELLMTMHGMFWRFPRTFNAANTAGIRPRSSYVKVIGDFCGWNDRLVLGCDDTAKSEFLNKRKVKGEIEGPGQSQSNLWFVDPTLLDRLGPTNASGAVWMRDAVKAGDVSDPMLLAGWKHRSVHFVNDGKSPASFVIEADDRGDGKWREATTIEVPAGESHRHDFTADAAGEWVRVQAKADCSSATVHFAYSNDEVRTEVADAIFNGLSSIEDTDRLEGLVRARGENKRTLQLAAQRASVEKKIEELGSYEMDASLTLVPMNDPKADKFLRDKAPIPRDVVTVDAASVLVVDDRGRRWRLPKGHAAYDDAIRANRLRISREVATERDLLSLHGTFYTLPAENADGFAKLRPISSHNLGVMDYCSFRGLLVLTGVKPNAPAGEHIVRSADDKAAVWVGAIDDLWKLGKPRGVGGPWNRTAVKAGEASDPYLAWGYDKRRLTLSHDAKESVTIRVEADLTGEGLWITHQSFVVPAGETTDYQFPAPFQARWLRTVADKDCNASAMLKYE